MSSDHLGILIELGEVKTDPKLVLANDQDLHPASKKLKCGSSYKLTMFWEKILGILIFIVTITCLILLIVILRTNIDTKQRMIEGKKNEADKPCLTYPCLQAALQILNSLNTSVDPCVDFNRFVCDKWQSEQVIPMGSSRFSTFDNLNSKLFQIQKKLLESSQFKSISPVYSKAIRLYNSCLNFDKINELGSKPLESYINKFFGKFGGWEMQVDDMDSSLSKWDLMKVIEDPFIESPVFSIDVETDLKNSSRNLIVVDLATLLLEKKFLQNPERAKNKKIIDVYRKYMYDIGKLLNLNQNKFNQFDEILKLEIQISKKYPTNEVVSIPENIYNKMKIIELQNKYCPEFNWKEIFKRRMELVKMQLNEDMEVIVLSPLHLREICKLFKYDRNTVRLLHNYVIWRSIHSKIQYLSEDFQRAKSKFQKVYYGVTGSKDRWKQCVSVVQDEMGLLLGSMYIKNNFHKDSKTKVTNMINLLKVQFHDNLIRNTWMDEKTKSHAIKKIDAISPLIGFSDSILNITYLEQRFADIEINEEKYFENMESLTNREVYISFAKLEKRPENSTIKFPPKVNAFYNSLKNEIKFPAGILQNPFFELGAPESLNYGGIGTVMGHEITHGFDNSGSKFDFQGNLTFWWTDETRKLFKAKADCFVKQYSKYSMHGYSINGESTLGENIADNGGLRLSYQVFKDLEKKYGKEKRLPGLNYTPDQLLFITFARLWCSVQTQQGTILQILSNSHTPGRYRVIGTLSNLKEFAEAFNCPLGSPMNPVEKCMIW